MRSVADSLNAAALGDGGVAAVVSARGVQFRSGGLMDLLRTYVDGWRHHDIAAVLATLAEDCVVIESYGPIYRGRSRVKQWMETWLAAGGVVLDWQITNSQTAHDVLIAEWTFTCSWRKDISTFQGATIARHHGGKITYLREYATTATLYEWTGIWRE